MRCSPVALLASLLLAPVTLAQFSQQGPKLVGTGAEGGDQQGYSVAISTDGTTAIVGAPGADGWAGEAWVFTWNGSDWIEQERLFAATFPAIGNANQGESVALSADGSTAIVGGSYDDALAGAAWIFVRTAGVWSEQAKLVGTDAIGKASQGYSVALSDDGNTAIVAGVGDNSNQGAAWVFTRDAGGSWSQQAKLVVSDGIDTPLLGRSVALSGDGTTALLGGSNDDSAHGAAWVFVRGGDGTWSQQEKLVGTGAGVSDSYQGWSVDLAGDGNTAIVGGPYDAWNVGAAWIFARSGGAWTQVGNKLVGSDPGGDAQQGLSVAISADGATALIGGNGADDWAGAAWVFIATGDPGTPWVQQTKLVGTGAVNPAFQGLSVGLAGDGETAIVGGPGDNGYAGAAWVFAMPAAPVTLTRLRVD